MATITNQHVGDMSNELQEMLDEYPNFKYLKDKNRIQDILSGHEMPCKLEAVKSYMQGKKFKKLYEQRMFDYKKYAEHIIPSIKKNREHQLFCTLTLRHLNNTPVHIQRHIDGRRFQKAYKKWEECQKKGIKFVPNTGRPKLSQHEDSENEDSGDELPGFLGDEDEIESDNDSLSDLFPAQDFVGEGGDREEVMADENELSGSDFDFEEDEENQGEIKEEAKPVGNKKRKEKGSKKNKAKKRKTQR